MARRYGEDFKRQAVELMIHSGKTQRQVARELDISEYSLNLWKKAYLGQQALGEINGQMKGPEEMAEIIRQQHKEIGYLKRLTQHQGVLQRPVRQPGFEAIVQLPAYHSTTEKVQNHRQIKASLQQ